MIINRCPVENILTYADIFSNQDGNLTPSNHDGSRPVSRCSWSFFKDMTKLHYNLNINDLIIKVCPGCARPTLVPVWTQRWFTVRWRFQLFQLNIPLLWPRMMGGREKDLREEEGLSQNLLEMMVESGSPTTMVVSPIIMVVAMVGFPTTSLGKFVSFLLARQLP